MTSRLALHPDLNACMLEDRTLPAYPVGLIPPAFIPSSAGNPQFVVNGFQQSSSGPSGPTVYPGPNWYYLTLGVNSGYRTGTAVAIYGGSSAIFTLSGD